MLSSSSEDTALIIPGGRVVDEPQVDEPADPGAPVFVPSGARDDSNPQCQRSVLDWSSNWASPSPTLVQVIWPEFVDQHSHTEISGSQ